MDKEENIIQHEHWRYGGATPLQSALSTNRLHIHREEHSTIIHELFIFNQHRLWADRIRNAATNANALTLLQAMKNEPHEF